MPNLELIPVRRYEPDSPYHHFVDNQPIDDLTVRINLLNNQVDNDADILRESIGSQGTLSNRLAQSLEDDGSIKTVALDNALHSIAAHTDGDGYVRMTIDERAKLSNIATAATRFGLRFETISGILSFDNGILPVGPSDTISWRYQDGTVFADNAFPSSVRHIHHYNITPVHEDLLTPDYQTYKTTSLGTAYKAGSLRVYINGIRLSPNATVEVPIWDEDEEVYVPTEYSFTEDDDTEGVVETGLFTLSSPITSTIVIFIDFDVSY